MTTCQSYAVFYSDANEAKIVFNILNEYNRICDEEFRAVSIRHCKIVKPLRNQVGKLVRRGFICLFAVRSIMGKSIISKYFTQRDTVLICYETLIYSVKVQPDELYPNAIDFNQKHFGMYTTWFIPEDIEMQHGQLSTEEMEVLFLEFITINTC